MKATFQAMLKSVSRLSTARMVSVLLRVSSGGLTHERAPMLSANSVTPDTALANHDS